MFESILGLERFFQSFQVVELETPLVTSLIISGSHFMEDEERSAAATIRVSSPTASANEVASVIHLQPTRLVQRVESAAVEARWLFDSHLPESASIEEHIEALLYLVEKHKPEFESLPPDCAVDIWCTISSQKEFVGFALPKAIIQRAAVLGLEFVFSVYCGADSGTDRIRHN
jgi:hypothetical protein